MADVQARKAAIEKASAQVNASNSPFLRRAAVVKPVAVHSPVKPKKSSR